jgi:hypothetical protein
VYLLDSDVLIEAKNRYYTFEFVPGFWEWIEQMHANGKVFSVTDVRTELLRVQDELSDWVKKLPDGFFLESDTDLLRLITPLPHMQMHTALKSLLKKDLHQIARSE